MMTAITIVGGGATGAAILISLLKTIRIQNRHNFFDITIFEPKNELGLGLAYSAPLHDILLNTSVGSTTIDATDHLHFFHWLQQNEATWRPLFPHIISYSEESFLPRALCGLYIHETLKNELALMNSANVKFQHIQERVTDIKLANTSPLPFRIFTAFASYSSNVCILATGYGQGFSNTYSYLEANSHYFSSPYLCMQRIREIPLHKKILIIGMGLSAIDTSLILKNHNNITVTSRRGFIPAVRNRLIAIKPKHLTDEFQSNFFDRHSKGVTIQQIRHEIEQELSLRHENPIRFHSLKIDTNSIRQLREDITVAKRKKNQWEDSMLCILSFIDNAWNYLSDEDRNELITNEMRFISRYISSFPLINAKSFYRKIKNKTLSIKKNIANIYMDGDGFRAEFQLDDHIVSEYYDYVINATPVDKYITILPGLYFNLLDHGLVKRNAFGGLEVNRNCHVMSPEIKQLPFFAAGPITKGCFLVTNLLSTCAKQAKMITKAILTTG